MKDVKTKPKGTSTPKDKVKSQISSTVKDAKANLKNRYINSKAEEANKSSEEQKNPENYAVDTVEDKAKTAVQSVYGASSRYISSKLKQKQNNEYINAKDAYDNTKYSEENYNKAKDNIKLNEPKQKQDTYSQIKQKPEHTNQPEQHNMAVKTKQEYVKKNIPEAKESVSQPKIRTQQYISKTKNEVISVDNKGTSINYNSAFNTHSAVKTKEAYIQKMTNTSGKTVYRLKTNTYKPKTLDKVNSVEYSKPIMENPMQKFAQNKLKTKAAVKRITAENNIEVTDNKNVLSVKVPELKDELYKNKLSGEIDNSGIPVIPKQKQIELEHLKKAADIKTKEKYIQSHNTNNYVPVSSKLYNTEQVLNPYNRVKADIKLKPKNGSESVRIINNSSHDIKKAPDDVKPTVSLKAQSEISRPLVKNKHSAYKIHKLPKTQYASKVSPVKTMVKHSAVKTQKQVTKQAAKKAAKRAKETAQRSAKTVKAAAKATVKITKVIVQAVIKAAEAVASAIAAFGGWAVLLVVLIIVIIVAAVAASPFGIFISEEAYDPNNIPISAIIAEINEEFSQRLEEIETSNDCTHIETTGSQANWDEVLAVFAVKVAGVEDDTVMDVVIIDDYKKSIIKDIFRDMNEINYHVDITGSPAVNPGEQPTEERTLYIEIKSKTAEDMIREYSFTERQQEALKTLLENNEVLISASHSLAVSDATAADILRNLPNNLPQKRRDVIKAACSLVGKINYFWGGKSSAIGWDPEWGQMRRVTSSGSSSSGTMRPYGMDCSGFVTWAFHNSGMSENAIGHGTQGQIANCTRISWNEAQTGDLAFYSDLSHIGIIAGKDRAGNIIVIHCSSSRNNVVITTNSGFGFAARPRCY